jgi:proline racemase
MQFSHVFRTIETHTGGNPTRTIVSGVPNLVGDTMMEKAQYLVDHYDWIRQALMYEPRGHGVMSGVVVTEPVHPEADFGVIYIEVGGLLPMCGHDTIGFVTALVETGQVSVQGGRTEIVLDTPSGLVRAEARVEDGRATAVSFENVVSFVAFSDLSVEVPDVGPVTLDIAWGGNFYGIVEAASVGLTLTPNHAREAIRLARKIRKAVDSAVEVVHPEFPNVRGLTHVEFYGPPTKPGADVKNMVVVPPGGVDRSPCGTGTSAKAAVLHARGALPVGASFVHESVTGALFTATVLGEEPLAGHAGVRVRVSGSAHLYGDSTFVVDGRDPLKHGFLLP